MQVTANRPFSRKLREVLARLVTAARSAEGDGRVEHPLLEVREVKRVLYVVITADRGLAGGYNVNVIRRLQGIWTRRPGSLKSSPSVAKAGNTCVNAALRR